MKITLKLFAFVLIMPFVCNMSLFAQLDTLDIPLEDGQSMVLKETIDSDQGQHVYRLERGGYYWITGIIEVSFPLHIVGKPEPSDQRPPVLIYLTDETGDAPDIMFQAYDDVYLKNLYFAAIDDGGELHRVYKSVDDSLRLVVDHCFFNFSSSHQSNFEFRSLNGDCFFTNNFVMNMQQEDGYTWTKFLRTSYPDTVVFQNNSFFNISSAMTSSGKNPLEGPNFGLYEHNTFVNMGKDPIHHTYWINTVQANNLFKNPLIHGDAIDPEAPYTSREQDSDNLEYAMFRIDTLAAELSETQMDSALAVAGVEYQTAMVHHNNWYQSPELVDYLDSLPDEIGLVPPMFSARTIAMDDNDEDFPGIQIDRETCWAEDPGFTKDPTDVNRLIAWCEYEYYGGDGVNFIWDPDDNWLTLEWPIIGEYVDFTYSNENLRTADGMHIGDLNWYPDELETWQTGVKSKDVAAPALFKLSQNYPNPFNPITYINYELNTTAHIKLTIYNTLGQQVAILADRMHQPGPYMISWEASEMPSGVYFCRLESKNKVMTKKMMLVK